MGAGSSIVLEVMNLTPFTRFFALRISHPLMVQTAVSAAGFVLLIQDSNGCK